MIEPTIGRVVHYYASHNVRPQAAIVCDVIDTRTVGLMVVGHDGSTVAMPSPVLLVQPEDDIPGDRSYCAWMPYQVKKDFGSESGERSAGTQEV